MVQDGLVYFVALTGKMFWVPSIPQQGGASASIAILTIMVAANIVNLILYRASNKEIQVR